MPSYCTKKYISAECCPIVQQCTIGQSEQFFLILWICHVMHKKWPLSKAEYRYEKTWKYSHLFGNQQFWSCYCLRFEFLRLEKTDTQVRLYCLSFVFEKTLKLVPFIEAIFCKYFGYQTKCEYFADFSYLSSDLERGWFSQGLEVRFT